MEQLVLLATQLGATHAGAISSAAIIAEQELADLCNGDPKKPFISFRIEYIAQPIVPLICKNDVCFSAKNKALTIISINCGHYLNPRKGCIIPFIFFESILKVAPLLSFAKSIGNVAWGTGIILLLTHSSLVRNIIIPVPLSYLKDRLLFDF